MRTKTCRAKYALEFEELLVEKLLQNVPISVEFRRITSTITEEWLQQPMLAFCCALPMCNVNALPSYAAHLLMPIIVII